ncbi:ABC transporter substrate-binding protein [Microbacterium amylolyticum]|uniref:Peptide/nickel transport system substrate-binding protein n=1 Tax=Microbacterium amylolyticum TaxID=936337 RepID=A0ABS4ZED5_9MICO|nr:peptide/nickel transport system substrate-binding protein [Microbacterium amylolyticum]
MRRITAAVAASAAAALVFSACAPPEAGTDGDNGSEGGGSTVSQSISLTRGAVEFAGYNGRIPSTYNTYNSVILDQVLIGFSYFGPEGEIEMNTDLGSYELVSDDPMVIEYTINDNAVWSDGTPITVADSVLAWGTQNPNLELDGEPLFNSVSVGLGDEVPAGPQGDVDGKSFTVEYADPNPDWRLQTWLSEPAHIVAEQAGMSTTELAEAILAGDSDAIADAAEFWNTGWNSATGTLPDAELIPASGPYTITSWAAGESVTLTANESYYGSDFGPQNDELIVRFVADDAMPQALDNGDVNVIGPQPTVDTLAQLSAMDGVTTYQRDTLTWEHLDFNFIDGGLFADDLELREAFALCVPRQQIIDTLIAPINPDAQVMNAREVFPFQDDYAEVTDFSYDGRYDEVDIDASAALLDASGADNLDVRIGYQAPNPRRSEQVELIKASCDQAGFNIIDGGSEEFFAEGGVMDRGDYEVALFAWAGSGQITSGENIYATGKPQNFGKYSNETVDEAWSKLIVSLDEDVQLEQTKIIEKELWDSLHGIPLFAHPGVDAAASDIENVIPTATQGGISWNAYAWHRAE